jgi:hypothetical protein
MHTIEKLNKLNQTFCCVLNRTAHYVLTYINKNLGLLKYTDVCSLIFAPHIERSVANRHQAEPRDESNAV